MNYEGKLSTFFRDTVGIPQILDRFRDVRPHPRIALRDILACVFLMPVWGMTALLRLDIRLRTPKFLKMFHCPEGKTVVVSDTTIARVLNRVDQQQSAASLFAPFRMLNTKGLLQRRLSPKGPSRRICVCDGSQMGQHYLVAALLCGTINYPLLVEPCAGRGHELKTVQRCLPSLAEKLGRYAPQLYLFDALYFTESTFRIVRSLNAHLLLKYSPSQGDEEDKLFRDVLVCFSRVK